MKPIKSMSMVSLTLILGATMVAGCSGNKSTESQNQSNTPLGTYPIVKDKITMKVMGSKTPAQAEWGQMALFQQMEKLTNIHLEFDTPTNTAYLEKLNLAFASDALPDFLFGAALPSDKEVTWGQQGLLIPLEGLIQKYAPNLKKTLDDYSDIKKSITAPDGHIYSLPMINYRKDMSSTTDHTRYNRIWINTKWLKQLNLQMPKTTDELVQVMKAFKEKDPNQNGKADEIPMTAFQMNIRQTILNWFGFAVQGSTQTTSGLMDVSDGKVRFVPMEPQFKDYLTFMNQLYNEGLLDKESYSQSQQQEVAKGNSDQLGMFQTLAPFQIVGNTFDPDYDILPPLTSPDNNKQLVSQTVGYSPGTFAITKADKNPEATIRWVDYLYTEDGATMANWGVEGVTWKWSNAEKTKMEYIKPAGSNMTSEELRGQATPNAGTPIPRSLSKAAANTKQVQNSTGTELHWAKEYSQLIPFAKPVYPNIYFKNDEQQTINGLQSDILTYVEQMEAKFIFGQEPLSNYDNFIKTLKNMNVDQFIKIQQQAYDRWNK